MNWEAIVAIGGFCLVLGILLYLPAYWWARRRLRTLPAESEARSRVTGIGLAVNALMLVVMLAGLSSPLLLAHTWVGRELASFRGALVFMAGLTVAWSALESWLEARGLPCWERPEGAAEALRKRAESRVAQAAESPARQSGYARLATIAGIPLLVHWSFPAGGLLVASFANAGFPASLYYCLAYSALVALHEAGHVTAARALRLKVYRVEISGFGGLCYSQHPVRVRDGALLFAAGLLTQVILLILTLGWLMLVGTPHGDAGKAFADTFVTVNLVLLAVNLIPQSFASGLGTDGLILWRIFLHLVRAKPNPFAPAGEVVPPTQMPELAQDTRLE